MPEEALRERAERREELKSFVAEQFKNLNIEIEKDQFLFERLVDLAEMEHFQDAVEMAEIIRKIPKEKLLELGIQDTSKLEFYALIHDIGKTGPPEAGEEEKNFFRLIFQHSNFENNRDSSISTALDNELAPKYGQDLIKKMKDYLATLGFDLENDRMIDLWRSHARFTYEILKKVQENGSLKEVDEKAILVASSHHFLDSLLDKCKFCNPAKLSLEELPADARMLEILSLYQILTLVDKYQAWRGRSHLSHQEAIEKIRNDIEKLPSNFPKEIKENYLKILEVLNFLPES